MSGVPQQYKFLSHLCGEEDHTQLVLGYKAFLSHLCGEEDRMIKQIFREAFLSHLCGEEVLA